jgi:cobalamin synthase
MPLTLVPPMGITGLAGLSVVYSSAPARGIAGTGDVASTAESVIVAVTATDAAVMVMVAVESAMRAPVTALLAAGPGMRADMHSQAAARDTRWAAAAVSMAAAALAVVVTAVVALAVVVTAVVVDTGNNRKVIGETAGNFAGRFLLQ